MKIGIGNIDLRNIRKAFSRLPYWTTLSPTGLIALASSTLQINLSVTDVFSGKAKLAWYGSNDGVTFTLLSTTATGTLVYSETGLSAGVLRYYKVRAEQGSNHSSWSNIARAATIGTYSQAFITATGITDATQIGAIATFVYDLIAINAVSTSFVDFATPANGVLKAVYPFVGGTATTHKFNLINPANTDGAFRLDFHGGLTHDTNGVLPDGATGYADTHFTPSTQLTQHSVSLAYYSLTNNVSDKVEMGVYFHSNQATWLSLCYAALGGLNSFLNSSGTSKVAVITDTRGLFISNRTAINVHKVYCNHELIGTTTVNNPGALSGWSLYLFAEHDTSGVEQPKYFTDRRCCYAHICSGIPDAAIQLYIKAVQDMQTTLSRGNMYVLAMATTGSPAAGVRVKRQIVGWNAAVYHSIYLPTNYSTDKSWPIILELGGNSYKWRTGIPEEWYMGYGLSKGKDFIWACVPSLNTAGNAILGTWWGDGTVAGDYVKSVEYWDAVINDIVTNYHGNSSKVIWTGFSRGAIAGGYINCSSDIQAAKFLAWIPSSHHDGGFYTPIGADVRLARMLGKKTCIIYNENDETSGKAGCLAGLALVQAAGVTEEHYQIDDTMHDFNYCIANDDSTVDSIRAFLAQYK